MTAKQNRYSIPGQPTIDLYTNQQVVIIHKSNYKDDDKRFIQIGYDEYFQACRILKDSTLKLYMYLSANMDGFQMALSPADICTKTGLSRKSYYNSKKELIENGYMIEHKANGKTQLYDCVEFYTNPELNPDYQRSA